MRRRNIGRKVSAAVLALSSVFTMNFAPVVGAAADTCTWTGGGTANNFNDAANWTGCDNGGLPEAGDTLKFVRLTGGGNISIVNDFSPELAFAKVEIDGGTPTDNTYYTIDKLKLADGGVLERIGTDNGMVQVTVANLTGQGSLAIRNSNTGSAWFGFSINAMAVTGVVTVEKKTNIELTGSDTVGGLAVQKGAIVYFDANAATMSFAAPITLGGGAGTNAPALHFRCTSNAMACVETTWNVTSAITLSGDATLSPGEATTANIKGALSGTGALSKDKYAYGVLNITPTSNTTTTPTGTLRNAPLTTEIKDETTDWFTVVDNETTILDGKRDGAEIAPGGTLKGSGTLTGNLYVAKGGKVAPGHSPGCLNTGDLTMAGTYEFEVGGAAACTGYDQINVTGTVNATGGTLNVAIVNSFAPVAGQKYVIVNNDGTDAVTGTFAGLAEGATFAVGTGGVFRISYVGGTGNDIELTVVTAPTVPDTGIEILMANPILSLSGAVLGAGALMVAARRVRA